MRVSSLSMKSDSSSEILLPIKEKDKPFILFRKIQGAMQYVPNLDETCKAILDIVMDEMEAENCSLMLKDPVSGDLSVRAARGKDEKKSVYYPDQTGNGRKFKSGEGIAGKVLKEGRAVMLNDVNKEPHFVKVSGLNNKVNSLICFPVREKDQVVGVFNLSHSKKGAFNEGDKMALSYVANQVGAALSSARFFLEIQEVNRLKKDSGEAVSKEETGPISSPGFSTLVEVGDMTQENGIFIYATEKMLRIKEIVDQVANTDVTVLIEGESGVGKEVVARSIHLNSLRRDKPFVKVNCAALPMELLESELFGYDKGAFTGAYRQKPGKFELADGGTILLDEIGEISLALQAKLLQVLQDREFSRLGGKKDVKVDVRVLASTNKNMEEAVSLGKFREDLYYRLNVVNIMVPPLRERKEEIQVFVEYFLDKFSKKFNKKVKPLPDKMVKALLKHQWSGNVRELENVIQRYVVLGDGEMMSDDISALIKQDPIQALKDKTPHKKARPSLKDIHRDAMIQAESKAIHKALEMTNWNRKKAAKLLNVSYKALLYKIKEFDINKKTTQSLSS
jgi:two-component system response regulator AtoC